MQVEDGVQIVGDFLFSPQADEGGGELVGAGAEIGAPVEFFDTRYRAGRRRAGSAARRVLIGDAHIDVAVDADALDAEIVVLRGLALTAAL